MPLAHHRAIADRQAAMAGTFKLSFGVKWLMTMSTTQPARLASAPPTVAFHAHRSHARHATGCNVIAAVSASMTANMANRGRLRCASTALINGNNAFPVCCARRALLSFGMHPTLTRAHIVFEDTNSLSFSVVAYSDATQSRTRSSSTVLPLSRRCMETYEFGGMFASMLLRIPDQSLRMSFMILRALSFALLGMMGWLILRASSGSSGSRPPGNGSHPNPASLPAASSSEGRPYRYSCTGSSPDLTNNSIAPSRFGGTLSVITRCSSSLCCARVRMMCIH